MTLGNISSRGRKLRPSWAVRCTPFGLAAAALLAPATARAAGYYPPTVEALGPWYGSGAPDFGAPGCGTATNGAEEFQCQIDRLVANDIPITVYLFDGSAWSAGSSYPWSVCEVGANCCNWKLGDAVIQRMQALNVRAILHFWGGCHTNEEYRRAYDKLGDRLLGFYLDDRSDDAEGKQVIDFLQSVMPGRSEAILKAYSHFEGATDEGLRANGNICYVNDLLTTKSPPDAGLKYDGLAEGIQRVFAKSPLLPAPFNEFTSYDEVGIPDEEQYVRRLHWGAMQPVMAQAPWRNADPWLPDYSPALVGHYRYYSWLHAELVPYLYSYVYNMHERVDEPVIRQPNAQLYTTKLGEEIFVAYVTRETQTLDVTFPAGTWIDYWNHDVTYAGGTTATLTVPLGREPIFFRDGAIVPMRVERAYTGHGTDKSTGSLTVLVFPGRSSTFRYREHAERRWITFASSVPDAGDVISIAASELPRQPILYRIERQAAEPRSVGASRLAITLNQGNDIPRLANEREVEEATSNAWTYDAQAKRVIVKFYGGPASDGGIADGGIADGGVDAGDGGGADVGLDGTGGTDVSLDGHDGGLDRDVATDGTATPDRDNGDDGATRGDTPSSADAHRDAERRDTPSSGAGGSAGSGPTDAADGSDCGCHLERRVAGAGAASWLVVLGGAFATAARRRRNRSKSTRYLRAAARSAKNLS